MHLEAKMSLGSNSHLGGCFHDSSSNTTNAGSMGNSNLSNLSNLSNPSNNINNNNATDNLDPDVAAVLKREAWLSPDVCRKKLVPVKNVAKFEPGCSPPHNKAPVYQEEIISTKQVSSQYSSENLTISDFRKRTDSVTTEEIDCSASDDENSYSLICASEQLPDDFDEDEVKNEFDLEKSNNGNVKSINNFESSYNSILLGSVQVTLEKVI